MVVIVMKIYLILVLLFLWLPLSLTFPFGPTVFAASQTVVLLTSLSPSSPSQNREIQEYEDAFRKYFTPQGYEVVIKHQADQYHLWKALHSPTTVALFWMSHGGWSERSCVGIGSQGMIADHRGFDVAPIFQEIHPNVRFLGVIACNAGSIIKHIFKNNKIEIKNPNLGVNLGVYDLGVFDLGKYALGIYASDADIETPKKITETELAQLTAALKILKPETKTISTNAFEKSLEACQAHLKKWETHRGYASPCIVRKGLKLKVTRKIEPSLSAAPAIRLKTQSSWVTVFPAARDASEVQEEEAFFEFPIATPYNGNPLKAIHFQIVAEAGQMESMPSAPPQLGRFVFEPLRGASEELRWEVKEGWDGKALGISKHIYDYKGNKGNIDLDLLNNQMEEFRPFVCDPMPALR